MSVPEMYGGGRLAARPFGSANGVTDHRTRGLFWMGISFKIHKFPAIGLFATPSVPVPGTQRGSEKSKPLIAFWIHEGRNVF